MKEHMTDKEIINKIYDHLNKMVIDITALSKLVDGAIDELEEKHPDKFRKRPTWPEMALDNAVEYIHEAADGWETIFILENK